MSEQPVGGQASPSGGSAAAAARVLVEVTHKCKHTVTHNMANVPAYDRKARAAWLAGKPCTPCWVARNKKRATTQWLKQKNAAELAIALRRADAAGLPVLAGSEVAVSFGARARDAALTRVREAYGSDNAGFLRDVLMPAKQIVTASWWINYHALSPDVFVPALYDAISKITPPANTPRSHVGNPNVSGAVISGLDRSGEGWSR